MMAQTIVYEIRHITADVIHWSKEAEKRLGKKLCHSKICI